MITRFIRIATFFFTLIAVVGISAYITLTLIIKSEDTVVVPELVGKDVVYVLEILTDLDLNTKVKGFGYSSGVPAHHIIFQEPEPGAEIKKGRDVRVIISKGAETVLMPNLKGLSLQQARIILEENGLRQGFLSRTFIKNVGKDDIITQVPSSGTMIKRDGSVNLLVSLGVRPKAYKMPDLRGLSLDGAILIIESSNMLLGEIKFISKKNKPENIIVKQEPPFGHRVLEKTSVNITINRKSNQKSHEHLREKTSGRLFRYRLENGFLKRHIRIRLNGYRVSNDLYDDFVTPGEEIWLLIPKGNDLTLILYEDDELVKTQVFNSW